MKCVSFILRSFIAFFMASFAQADKSDGLPDKIDPGRHYLFYLHGQIVEGSNGHPYSTEHGVYNYPEIIETLESKGFWVISEIRRTNTNPEAYAGLVAFYIDQLKKAGVPSSNITVVGASKGGIIACYASNKLQDPDINYVILAGFFYRLKDDPNMLVSGRVISIHDSADQNNINPKYFLKKSRKVTAQKVKLLREGVGHGLIYEPRYSWIIEVVNWSGINKKKKKTKN